MIQLIDPKRQAELEEIIVQLGATVGSLTENMEYLRDNNRRLTQELRDVQQTLRRLEVKFNELGRKMDICDTRVVASDYPCDTTPFTRSALDRVQSMSRTYEPNGLTRVNVVGTPTSSSSPIRDFYADYVQSIDSSTASVIRPSIATYIPIEDITYFSDEALRSIRVGPSGLFHNSERVTCE